MSHPLWRYSVERYARPQVGPALVALQDEHGLDVNVVLACGWRASLGDLLDTAVLRELLERTAFERQLAADIRALRRRVGERRDALPDLYAEFKRVELEVERAVQATLFAGLERRDPGEATPERAARESLGALAGVCGCRVDEGLSERFEALVAALAH